MVAFHRLSTITMLGAALLFAASCTPAVAPGPAGTPGAKPATTAPLPGVTPGAKPGATPGTAPGATPGVTPGARPGATPGAAAGGRRLVIATGGTAGTYFPLGGALATIFTQKVPGIAAIAQPTEASIDNIRLLSRRQVDLALVQNDIADYAYNGKEMFQGQPVNGFRGIAGLYPELVQVVVAADSPIASVSDLKAKRVAIGPAGSGTAVNARQVLDAYGLGLDDVRPEYLPFPDAAARFKARQLDALFLTAVVPTAPIQDVANVGKVRLLPIGGADAEKVKTKYRFFADALIPAKSYPGQGEPVRTVGVLAMLVARADLSTDLVYGLTKALFENQADLARATDKGKEVSRDRALLAMTVPVHPGAKKYFDEGKPR